MVSGHLIPKAPCASLVFLTGSVVISRPSRPVACRSRGTPGIDSTTGEVLREASTSDITLVAAVATRHTGRRPPRASSVWTQTGRALPPRLAISKTFSTRSRALRPLDALRRGPELARRQVVGEQAPGLAPTRPARPVHDPTQARTALPHGPGAVPADLTTVARSLPPATSWLTYMSASCGISESPLPHDTRCGRRAQATAKVSQQLGAGSRGRGRLGSASGGLRKCREVRVSELAREHCGSQIGIAVVDHVI